MSQSLDPRGAALASWPGTDHTAHATGAGQRVRGSRISAEFRFTDADFDAVRALIRRRAGIALAPAKRNLVYGRLSRRLRALGVASFADYLAQLTAPGSREWDAFTNALTTNLTSFYRESHHFPMLIEHLRRSAPQRPLTIWCCAASTGEEPYTIAIAACETFSSLTPPVSIIASDIDSDVLAVASRGIYLDERLAPLDPAQRTRYFEQAATLPSGHSRVRAELRRLIEFRRLNLIEANWRVPAGLAAIFCRNVLIYFERPTQSAVLARMASLLANDGLLFAGHSENVTSACEALRPLGKTVYARADERSGGRLA